MVDNAPLDFDEMSVEQQIAHVQDLWSRVASAPQEVPVPDWHLSIVRERLAAHQAGAEGSRDWDELYAELRNTAQ